jgi:virulence-associated protein VagC
MTRLPHLEGIPAGLTFADVHTPYIHQFPMPTVTAKVFKSGNSQAIRLPKAWRLTTATVQIEKTAHGLLILDPKAEAKRVKAFAKLYGSCPDFPLVEPLPLPEL